MPSSLILLRGGGDLATGVAARLYRAGLRVLITELAQPLVVRRCASFAQAIFDGEFAVEGITAKRIEGLSELDRTLDAGQIPVLIDPNANSLDALRPLILIDARMTKGPPEFGLDAAPLVIGLGPGFIAGKNCHAVVETMRGHDLGRVMWQGTVSKDSGLPDAVGGHSADRVLRAPADGPLVAHTQIGDQLKQGDLIAEVTNHEATNHSVTAPFSGVLRGLLYPGLSVHKGMKIGDLDPRNDPRYCTTISDKSLAVGGGVLEAILARPEIRSQLWASR